MITKLPDSHFNVKIQIQDLVNKPEIFEYQLISEYRLIRIE